MVLLENGDKKLLFASNLASNLNVSSEIIYYFKALRGFPGGLKINISWGKFVPVGIKDREKPRCCIRRVLVVSWGLLKYNQNPADSPSAKRHSELAAQQPFSYRMSISQFVGILSILRRKISRLLFHCQKSVNVGDILATTFTPTTHTD